eukprot:TRINITY_DN22296_c0_g1_i2.p1 TRINITY_DN22296_c0_g1~~TRINITY_DN22296_c0_g1_i2.p1  ORF type:complete len:313 (+),score=62.56 TRINITY_DN22296_c0_g1_i2:65-1003(+)
MARPCGLTMSSCRHVASRFAVRRHWQAIPQRLFTSTAYRIGPPVAALAPPGQCVFGEEWTAAKLLSKVDVSHDTRVLTFGLEDQTKSLGLSTCACLLARGGKDADGNPVVRPYTPVSTNAMVGMFELMVKVYPQGALSTHMDELRSGDELEFKHIPFNVKIQYPFERKRIGMLVGGTGITPMLQALHAVLGTAGDTTQVDILYGSRTTADILAGDVLDEWSKLSQSGPNEEPRLKVTHVLSHEAQDSSWTGARGFMSRELVEKHLPKPSEDCLLFVCGPPAMYDALCGPRGEKELSGLLADMGYSPDQVYKF